MAQADLTDKKTIGLTTSNRQVVSLLKDDRKWFSEDKDVAKFAMSYAIACGVETGSTEGAETVWNIGTFDPDGELKSLIPVLFPGTITPYRALEFLLNKGLEMIRRRVDDDPYLELSDLLP